MEEHQGCRLPETPEERREWIKYNLKIRGLSFSELGRRHNRSRQIVARALYETSPYWQRVIAEAVGSTPQALWPERFDENNLPLKAGGDHDI